MEDKLFKSIQKAVDIMSKKGFPDDAVIFEIDAPKLMSENEKLKQQILDAEKVIRSLAFDMPKKHKLEIAEKYWSKYGKDN